MPDQLIEDLAHDIGQRYFGNRLADKTACADIEKRLDAGVHELESVRFVEPGQDDEETHYAPIEACRVAWRLEGCDVDTCAHEPAETAIRLPPGRRTVQHPAI